jgi:hypothetical protein
MGVGSTSPLITVSLRIDLRAVDRAQAARALSADRGSCAGERLPSCPIISLQDRSRESDVIMAEEATPGTQAEGTVSARLSRL